MPAPSLKSLARYAMENTEDPQPYFYLPLTQDFTPERVLQVRSSLPPELLLPELQRQILALDANAPIEEMQTMKESLSGALGFFLLRPGASLASAMGLLGLFLAVQRTQEIGIRMAVGGSPRQIVGLLLKQGARLVTAGMLAGLGGAWALTRAMSHTLVGISPSDPVTYLVVSALLFCITLLACWIPARRAMRMDPMVALRHE
jgi:putative ABC transport system permease protein